MPGGHIARIGRCNVDSRRRLTGKSATLPFKQSLKPRLFKIVGKPPRAKPEPKTEARVIVCSAFAPDAQRQRLGCLNKCGIVESSQCLERRV
jgi:hypothetical protein